MGPFDVTVTFSKSQDVAGQTMVIDQGAVSFSPQHFKNFCLTAIESLKAYENVFGELKIPESDIAAVTSTEQIEAMLKAARDARRAIIAGASNPSRNASSSTEKKQPSRRSRGGGKG
jgi:hypothetical protein